MPNIVLFGHEWDTCTDMLPLNLFIPILVYIAALIPLATITYVPKEPECYQHPGHHYYRIGITLIFVAFCVQVGTEMLLFLIGLRGTPLQTKKRLLAEWLLVVTYLVNIVQLGGTIFGTWVLNNYQEVPCSKDTSLKPLVICSWILLGLSLLWTLTFLNWNQASQNNVENWVKKLRCVCFVCSCLGFQTALEPLRKLDLQEDEGSDASKRENALVEHLAETFHVIFGDVDFTVSDRHVALVLATALQQNRRHERIKECLLQGADPLKASELNTKEEKQFRKALRHSITRKFPTIVTPSNFARKVLPDLPAQEAAGRYTGFTDLVSKDDLEEALGYFEYAVAAYYVQDEGVTATGDGQTKGGAENVKQNSNSKDKLEGEQKVEPGSLADRPMGDAPPPKNEELADDVAPTFEEHPDPNSETIIAIRDFHNSSPPESPTKQYKRELSPVQESPSEQEGSLSGRHSASRGSPADQGDSRFTEPANGTSPRDAGRDDEPEGRLASRDKYHSEGGDGTVPKQSSEKDRAERDSVGSEVQGSSKKAAKREAVIKASRKQDLGSQVQDGTKGFAGMIKQAGQKAKTLLGGSLAAGKGEVELSSPSSNKPNLGSAKSKVEGVDKSAQKAMAGDMQKGKETGGSQKLSAKGQPVVDETGSQKGQDGGCIPCGARPPVVTPLDTIDCIYSRADNTILGTLPYMIALDWERRAVILGVRGTSSISDALTDAIAQPIPILPWLGSVITEADGGIASVHSGILASAAALNHDLEDHGILNALLSGAAVDEEAKQRHKTAQPAPMDDAVLAAALAAAPEAAAFMDVEAISTLANLQRSSPDRKPSSQADRHDSAPQAAAASPLLTPEPSGGSLNGTQHPAEGLRPDSTPGTQGSSGLPHKGPSRLGDDPVKAVNVGEEAGDAADRQTEQPKKDWVSPFASSTLQTDRPWRKPESNPATSTTHSRTHSGTSAVEPPRAFTARELMDMDDKVIQNYLELQKTRKLATDEAKRARARQKRHPQRKQGARTRSQTVPSTQTAIRPERGSFLRSFSSRKIKDVLPTTVDDSAARLQSLPDAAILDMGSTPAHQPLDNGQAFLVKYSHLASWRPECTVKPAFTPKQVTEGTTPIDRGPSHSSPVASATLDDSTAGAPAQVKRSRSERVFSGLQRGKRASTDARPEGMDRRFSMDRRGSAKLPEAFGNMGRAMRGMYTDAKGAFRDRRSPDSSPKRRRDGRVNEEAKHRRDGRLSEEAKRRRVQEAMKGVEAQLQKTFLVKIFKNQQDLLSLEQVSMAEENQKRRAKFRAKQLAELEKRKLDCRGWQLVLTGHSLGAGVAALLALKLRPRFPNTPVKCWAYCPPGGLVTAGLSKAMEPFCTSVIVGKDGVPRASLGNLSRLVDEVVIALARSNRCKAHIILRNLTSKGRKKLRAPQNFLDMDKIPEECQRVLDEYAAGAPKRMEAIGEPVYPPGRVVYCRRLKESGTEVSYDSIWVPPEVIIKEGFIISSKMLRDHLCDSVTSALEGSIARLNPKVDGAAAEAKGNAESPNMPEENSSDSE